MSNFTKGIKTKKISKKLRELLESFLYHVGEEDSEEVIVVPKGFQSDGASIPPPFWIIVGHPWAEYEQAAWLHDFLYYSNSKQKEPQYTRKRCDSIFLESMAVLGVSWWKRRVMYRGVRVFGGIPWNRHKKK